MNKRILAKDDDCVSSIAYDHGHFPDTVWTHAENDALRDLRKDEYVLFSGDEVFVPDIETKEESGSTDKRHRFRRRGVPEQLRLAILDEEEEPRAGLAYEIDIEGSIRTGETDASGEIFEWIPPDARSATLTLFAEQGEEVYPLEIGRLAPNDKTVGLQARLRNLGYDPGPIDGKMGARTRRALELFQIDNDLDPTGHADNETTALLEDQHVA